MSKRLKKIAKNEYIFSMMTKMISFSLGLIQSVLLARFLGAELKGVNAYISSITSVGSIVITFGMHQAYPYFRKKYGKDAIYQDYISLIMMVFAFYMIVALLMAFFLPVSIELKVAFILIPLLGYSHVVAYVTLIENPNVRNKWWTFIVILDVLYVFVLLN